jgi:hypothetical protein
MPYVEFMRRLRTYERCQQLALAIGVLPLFAVYLAVHTRWLKALMQRIGNSNALFGQSVG